MCIGDIEFQEDHIVLTLKQSKADPFRKGVHIKLFCIGTDICPMCQLRKYLELRKTVFRNNSVCDPLFVIETGEALTRSTFLYYFKQLLNAAGLSDEHYTGHSFRIGAATTAAAARIEDHLIKTMGRWSSDSYCRYIKTPKSAIHSVQLTMARTDFISE